MTDHEFDIALITGAFALAARDGWGSVSVVSAAREADLPLDRARTRFGSAAAILMRFGKMADAHALSDAMTDGTVRERLFDLLMRRFDALQPHRAGVLALLHKLPGDPATALLLGMATRDSMGWMLEAACVPAKGFSGALAVHGLVAVWLYGLRAWERDESADLSGTMAALDRALGRAEQAAGWLGRGRETAPPAPKPFPDPIAAADAAPIGLGIVGGASDMPPPESGAI